MLNIKKRSIRVCAAAATMIVGALLASSSTFAEPLGAVPTYPSQQNVEPVAGMTRDQTGETELAAHLQRRTVEYSTREAPGTIIIDTPNTYLYYVLGQGRAIRYGIGVGREGFTWSGTKSIARKQEWPDWYPPDEMIARQPYLPRMMAGGPGNPLGARAMYLGGTVYRIHGTNAPNTIGKHVSSGCIRLINEDIMDLYERTNVGTKVIVLPVHPAGAPVAERDQLKPNPMQTVMIVANDAHKSY
jgi:lipoprotein-anchoring transpeptidase ErfK/SrfK